MKKRSLQTSENALRGYVFRLRTSEKDEQAIDDLAKQMNCSRSMAVRAAIWIVLHGGIDPGLYREAIRQVEEVDN